MGSPPMGATNAGVVGKNLPLLTKKHYNSKTIQDRCIVSIKVEWEVICALSNGDVSDDDLG